MSTSTVKGSAPCGWQTERLTRTALIWIIASATVSIAAALFSYREASLGIERVVALSDARKVTRQTLVSLLDQDAALTFYMVTGSVYPLLSYQDALMRETALQAPLKRSVIHLLVPGTRVAFEAFERHTKAFHADAGRQLRRSRSGSEVSRAYLGEARTDLNALIKDFDVAGTATVVATKSRLIGVGVLSVCFTCFLGIAALLTETLRRRAARRRAVDLATKTQQLQTAHIQLARTSALEAGKAALEREVEVRIEAEKRLAHAAYHDALTGLPNRAYFIERINALRADEHSTPALWAILFLDLDGFKLVNDSLGHAAGDRLLVAVARRLERCLRAGDVLARLGGDEFTILLNDIDSVARASSIADRMLAALTEHFSICERDVFVTASIGIAAGPDISKDAALQPEDVLRNADIAMFRAKKLGKKRHEEFSPELHAHAIALLELRTDLAQAIERNEFELYYQPIVNLHDGDLSGFEALVRWQHPHRGLVYPDEFIGLAEEDGSIIVLGEWILVEACRQMQEWCVALPDIGAPRVSVNVSAKQLASPNFLRSVERALSLSGLNPARLNVEITESAIMENAQAARSALLRLREVGVRVHLDDFGTGYSSLAYLHEFPIDTLKIDRSFVSRLGAAVSDPEIVRAVIALARSLDIKVTAEGVETERQYRQLQEMGCSNGQGYYWSRPVPGAMAGQLLRTGMRDAPQPPREAYRVA